MKTKNEIKGYQYSNSGYTKKWKRGRIIFSTGRKYFNNNDFVNVITKTNLDTCEITIATLNEAKRFLTEEGFQEYKNDNRVKKAMEDEKVGK